MLKTAGEGKTLSVMLIKCQLLMWAQVQFSPDSRPAFAVALLQIDVLRFDGYLSDHVDDGMRPGGRGKR